MITSISGLVSGTALPAVVLLLKITLVLLVALGATLAMQRTSAGARHLVWLVALGALLLLPPLAVWGPLPIRVLPAALTPAASPTPETTALPLGATTSVPGPAAALVSGRQDSGAGEWVGSHLGAAWSGGSLLLTLWALVALGLAGRLLYGAWSVRRIVRRSRPLEHPEWQTPLYEIADRLELEAAPRLLRSDDVKMPFAAGLLSSTIVLPAESDCWSAERRSAVLIHELGHVRRRDLIGHTMSRIACTLYWFHPLVWTAARRLRAESERACDDLALVFGARPSDYAEHLLDIVTCVRDHNTPAVALAMAHRREFEGRMLAILNPELRRRGPGRVQTVSMVGSLALVALLIGAASPAPRRSSPSATPPGESTTGQLLADRTMQEPVAAPAVPTTVRPIQKPAPNPRPDPRPNPLADPQPPADLSSAEQPDDERAAVLAKTLRTDSNAGVRRVAAWGLRRYAQMDVALEALVGALGNDADASVREMSAWALQGARRNSTASAAIAKAIRQDKNAEVRATAVWAAGSIGDGSAVDALVGVLGDAEAEVREMAAWSIGACSPDHAPAALLRALTDKERDVRLSAAWALYQIRDPETVSAIDAAFQHESDGEVREGLIRALGQMGDRAVDALQRLVTSPDSTIRTVAVTALAGGNATGPWPWPRPQPRPYP